MGCLPQEKRAHILSCTTEHTNQVKPKEKDIIKSFLWGTATPPELSAEQEYSSSSYCFYDAVLMQNKGISIKNIPKHNFPHTTYKVPEIFNWEHGKYYFTDSTNIISGHWNTQSVECHHYKSNFSCEYDLRNMVILKVNNIYMVQIEKWV